MQINFMENPMDLAPPAENLAEIFNHSKETTNIETPARVMNVVNYNTFEIPAELSENDLETITKIKEVLVKGNFQTAKKIIGKTKLFELLNNLYPRNDLPKIEKILGIPDSTLARWYKELGIKLVRSHVSTLVVPSHFDGSIVIANGATAKNISAVKVDEDLAYLIGFCIGDGAIQKFMVEAFNKDAGVKQYLKTTMERYGKVQDVLREDGLWKLRLSSVKIAALIKQNGKIVDETINYVLSDKELASRFVAGLWDAEGSVLKQNKYIHVYLYNGNKKLIDIVSNYLTSRGIKNSIIVIKQRVEPYYYKGHPIISKKQMHRIGIPKSHLKQWKELIGLHLKHSKKSAVVLEI